MKRRGGGGKKKNQPSKFDSKIKTLEQNENRGKWISTAIGRGCSRDGELNWGGKTDS